jgi:hypothetical protein
MLNRLRTKILGPRRSAVRIPLLGVMGNYVWIGVDAIFAGQHANGPLFAFRTHSDSIEFKIQFNDDRILAYHRPG